MKITKAQIIGTPNGPDTILLVTDLPEPTWPFKGFAALKLVAATGTGIDYVKKHFNLEPEIIR